MKFWEGKRKQKSQYLATGLILVDLMTDILFGRNINNRQGRY